MESEPRSPAFKTGRSRNLSFRKKARAPKPDNAVQKDEVKADSHSDQERLIILLKNLDIRFVDCTFTYKQSHFDGAQQSTSALKRRSRLAALKNTISNSIERMREAVTCEKTFNNCIFVPMDEKDKVKDFIRSNYSEAILSFEHCKFVKRSASLPEKVARRLRKIFGIQFELEYINSTATINDYTFRIKDILFVNQHIQERIVEEA